MSIIIDIKTRVFDDEDVAYRLFPGQVYRHFKATCPIPDVCNDERRLPLFIARATLSDLIAGLEACATGGVAR